MKVCTIKDCERKHKAKGLCEKHYGPYWIANNPALAKDARRDKKALRCAVRRWKGDNHTKVLAAQARRRALGGTPDKAVTQSVFEANGCLCVYCGEPAETVDHVLPLSRGGTSAEDNLVPSCVSCNSSKQDRTPEEWAASVAARRRALAKYPEGKWTL